MDSIPIVSQTKSLFQWIAGDSKGARVTQENFCKGCPGVSQYRSAVQALGGDEKGARDTQLYFLKNAESIVDAVPIAGHFKGGIHYALGDTKRGDDCMKNASRTAGVIAGGAAGFAIGGPGGAFAGGAAAGAVMDVAITGVESAITGEYVPYGVIDSMTKIVNKVATPGEIFETFANPILDGYGGTVLNGIPKPMKVLKRLATKAGVYDGLKRTSTRARGVRQRRVITTAELRSALDGLKEKN